MLFSRDWLAEYVELPRDPQELADRLTLAGFAVEHVEEKDGDVLFDIDVTTNRPDCMNHRGLAREIAVLFEKPLGDLPAVPREGGGEVGEAAAVEVEEPEACPRFAARVIRGVRTGESPAWLKKRLQAIGLRPINNIVDITNYVLWETGQPLHAYDLAKLAESRLVARRARQGEKLTTLDGVERQLTPQMLVIADAEKPVGLAGVMGGLDSEVTDATVDVLLEGAHFDRRAVRAAARGLGMHTDASHRFERGADPGGCRVAVDRAAGLIAEMAGGTVLAGAIDVDHPELYPPRRGRLDLVRLAAFAGAEIAGEDAVRWLTALGFGIEPTADAGVYDVTVPSWRYYDFEPRTAGRILVYEADLFEEVVRVFGFDRIPNALPEVPGTDGPRTELQRRRDLARRHLAACGFAEAVHYAFLDPASEAVFPSLFDGPALRLANPLSELYSVLRRSLVPNLVASARFNQRRGAPSVRLFEVATVFFGRPGAELPDQPEHVALVAGGRVGQPWDHAVELDLFDLKGAVESLAAAAGARLEWRPADLPGLSPGSAAWIEREGRPVGFFGLVLEEEGYPLYVAELAFEGLAATVDDRTVALPSKLPGISVDLTLTHPLSTPWAEIEAATKALAVPELVSFGLKDRYSGAGVPEGAVNTTIHFFYNAADRSLTQEEVNAWQAKLTGSLVERFGVQG